MKVSIYSQLSQVKYGIRIGLNTISVAPIDKANTVWVLSLGTMRFRYNAQAGQFKMSLALAGSYAVMVDNMPNGSYSSAGTTCGNVPATVEVSNNVLKVDVTLSSGCLLSLAL